MVAMLLIRRTHSNLIVRLGSSLPCAQQNSEEDDFVKYKQNYAIKNDYCLLHIIFLYEHLFFCHTLKTFHLTAIS